jgi:hypothetical protein
MTAAALLDAVGSRGLLLEAIEEVRAGTTGEPAVHMPGKEVGVPGDSALKEVLL